ncbi:unnamed protein product [Phytomonas sp. Hart1]|nr:unnamed protein product [Phytomonas sp. Hart1]|eukprot:CCW69958.1 unnamed protein product [Phytomonas sp. isolate Hart1]
MKQTTLFDSFESAKKNTFSREKKRYRKDEEPVESLSNFLGETLSLPTEQILPHHFFSLCGTEHSKKVCSLWKEREERIHFFQHQNIQKGLRWNHFSRNEEGNSERNGIINPPLSRNVYQNSIIDISSDINGQVFFALQRSGFNLFSSIFSHEEPESKISKSMVLRLDSNNIREHRSIHPSRSFIFSCSHFIGNSLFVACGYSRIPLLEIFDLEDVDETACDPIWSFHLDQIQRSQDANNIFIEEDTPFVTDIISLSNNLSTSGLSSGESIWIDLRQKVAIQCTPRIGTTSSAQNLFDMSLAQKRPSPLTSILFSSSNSSLLITGAKDGRVSLWDIRYPKDSIDSYRSGSEIGRLWTYTGNGKRMGCPQVWFNNYRGDIVGLAMGNDSFSEIFSLKTEDSMRDNFSNNITTQKLSLSNEGLVFYPHISKNSILVLDIEAGVRGFLNEKVEAASFGNATSYQPSKFQSADSLFIEDPFNDLHNIVDSKVLRAIFSFSDTSDQISACSVFDDPIFLLVGSSVGGLSLIHNKHIY